LEGRPGECNALFAELLVTTGLRLEEAASLLAIELPALEQLPSGTRSIPFRLPGSIAKGGRSREIRLPVRLLRRLHDYAGIERANALTRIRRLPSRPLIAAGASNHARFYLTIVDIIGFTILLSLSTGMEMECIFELKADCLGNRARGFVDIAYFKRRAHGTEWKRLRVRDGGLTTPGGLIRLAIRLTERGRKRTGSDRLWVWGSLTGLMQGVASRGLIGSYFVREHGLVDEHGASLRLELSRLRKTYKAKWYARTGGQLEDFARGHSVDVAADHYADIPALRPLHEAAVVAAIEDAMRATELAEPRIIDPVQEARIRAGGDGDECPAALGTEDVGSALDGGQDVWLAGCANFHDSPFGRPGEACPSPFWACLECRNAVITARKLPALIAFETFMAEQREALSLADWEARFGRAWRRIREQILPAFPKAVVASARATAASADDLIYLPAEVVAT